MKRNKLNYEIASEKLLSSLLESVESELDNNDYYSIKCITQFIDRVIQGINNTKYDKTLFDEDYEYNSMLDHYIQKFNECKLSLISGKTRKK